MSGRLSFENEFVVESPRISKMAVGRMERSDLKIQHCQSNGASEGNPAHEWTRVLSHCGVAIAVLAFAFPAWGYSNGIAGYAGAPGDPAQGQTQTCANCHVGGSYVGTLDLFVEDPEGIGPSDVVAVDFEFTVDGQAPARWGFNLIAIDDATGEPVGQLISINDTSQLKTSGRGWQYLSHTLSGRNSELDGKPGWATDWQAPPEPVESVSFYLAFNAANGGGVGGDTIFTEQVVVSVPEPGALAAGVIALMALAAVRSRRD